MAHLSAALVIEAWRDGEFLDALTEAQKSRLPANPAGDRKLFLVTENHGTFITDTCSTYITDCCGTYINQTCT